jgi:proton glutamate symport protein
VRGPRIETPTTTADRTPKIPTSLTAWSLAGLGAGLLLGVMGNLGWLPWVGLLARWLDPLGTLWINALLMVVLPLIITQVLAAIVGGANGKSIGSLGGRALLLFLLMQAGFGAATMAISHPVVAPLDFSPETVAALQEQLVIPENVAEAGEGPALSIGEGLNRLIPTNVFAALVEGDLLAVILFAVFFGLAVTRLPEDQRRPLGTLFHSAAAAMMNVMVWVLWGTPVAVFAIILGLAMETGWGAAGVLGAYVGGVSGVLLLMTGLLYPLAVWVGRTSWGSFQRSVSAAQMVAISTRSSLATLPALIEGGGEHLHLPASITGFALPLTASLFKLTPLVSGVFLAVFIAHVFGIPLTLGQMALFLVFKIVLSVTIVGVPRGGGGFNSLPAYTAVGLPVEGVVLSVVVRTIPDIFMTLLNTTAYMTVGVLLSRGERGRGRE